MAAGPWTLVSSAITNSLNGGFDWDSDVWKIALFLSTSNISTSSTTYAGLTNEHANANGYTTGGVTTTCSLSGTTTVTVDFSDVSWTASGGSIVARFAVLYESGGNVFAFCLLDSTPADKTVPSGEIFEVRIHANGVFQVATA